MYAVPLLSVLAIASILLCASVLAVRKVPQYELPHDSKSWSRALIEWQMGVEGKALDVHGRRMKEDRGLKIGTGYYNVEYMLDGTSRVSYSADRPTETKWHM